MAPLLSVLAYRPPAKVQSRYPQSPNLWWPSHVPPARLFNAGPNQPALSGQPTGASGVSRLHLAGPYRCRAPHLPPRPGRPARARIYICV